MESGTTEVRAGTEVVNTAGHAFEQIMMLVEQVSTQVTDISASIHEVAGGSQQIVSSIQNIEQISKNTAAEAQTISAATEEPFVFDHFYQGDKSRDRKSGGTGLGLAIVKQLVEIHSGKTQAESEIGKGSSFYVLLPTKFIKMP